MAVRVLWHGLNAGRMHLLRIYLLGIYWCDQNLYCYILISSFVLAGEITVAQVDISTTEDNTSLAAQTYSPETSQLKKELNVFNWTAGKTLKIPLSLKTDTEFRIEWILPAPTIWMYQSPTFNS